MDTRKLQFLSAVLGADGAHALEKAAERSVQVGHALVPRTILAWLGTVSEYHGEVPGVPATHISFEKSDSGYSGSVTIQENSYHFEKASVEHLAAAVAVAIGVDSADLSSDIRGIEIERLGKSLDLLAKSKAVTRELAKKKDKKATMVELPDGSGIAVGTVGKAEGDAGPTAAPVAPGAPSPPTSTAPEIAQPKAKVTKPKLPRPAKPVSSYTLKVTKAEAARPCSACGDKSFVGSTFLGCVCFEELAPFVKTERTEVGFSLILGEEWDREALVTLIESLGR